MSPAWAPAPLSLEFVSCASGVRVLRRGLRRGDARGGSLGGCGADGAYVRTVHVLDPGEGGAWRDAGADMGAARYRLAACVVDGRILVAGGLSGDGQVPPPAPRAKAAARRRHGGAAPRAGRGVECWGQVKAVGPRGEPWSWIRRGG